MEHKETSLNYGDVVLFHKDRETIIPARVLQSRHTPVPDKSAPQGVSNQEELTIEYLDPKRSRSLMTQLEMDSANVRLHGIKQWKPGNESATGFSYCRLVPVDANEYDGNVQLAESSEDQGAQHEQPVAS